MSAVSYILHNQSLSAKYAKEAGFSLIELMIALVLGLLITLAAFQFFISSKENYDHASSVMKRQESVRHLVDTLSYDLRSADSIGILSSNNQRLSLKMVKENSFCSGDEYSVDYYADEVEGTILAKYEGSGCPAGGQSIALGVGSINFNYAKTEAPIEDSEADPIYSTVPKGPVGVIVTLTMKDEDGNLEDEKFVFRVANRSSVSKAIEYEVGS